MNLRAVTGNSPASKGFQEFCQMADITPWGLVNLPSVMNVHTQCGSM